MQGLNLKRILLTGPYCTFAPVSPLCCILDGCSTLFICKREGLSLKRYRAEDVFKTEYDLKNERRLSFIGFHHLCAWPPKKRGMRLGSPLPDSSNHVRGLNDLFLGALTCKVGIMCGCLGSRTFSMVKRHLEF